MKLGGNTIVNIDVCCYFSPECEGKNKDNCGYYESGKICPQTTINKKKEEEINMTLTVNKEDLFIAFGLIYQAILDKGAKSVNMDQVKAFKDARYASAKVDWNTWKAEVSYLIKKDYVTYKVLKGKAYFVPTELGVKQYNKVMEERKAK